MHALHTNVRKFDLNVYKILSKGGNLSKQSTLIDKSAMYPIKICGTAEVINRGTVAGLGCFLVSM